MKILIIEDEQHNQRLLKGMLRQIRPGWEICAILESVKESVAWLGQNKADLIFMDIQLVDGISFSIFDKVKVDIPVIFTTAYDNYAIQAFKVNSIDYLLKPIKESELEGALNKFEDRLELENKPDVAFDYFEILNAIRSGEKKYRSRFLIQGANSYYKLDVKTIAYFNSREKITFAVTFDNKEHIVDKTLEALEPELDPNAFFRANRSTIIHIDAVYKFENYFGGKLYVKLLPELETDVVISRLKNAAFKQWVGN